MFLAEIHATKKVLKLVGHFGTTEHNISKFHDFGTAQYKSVDIYQIGTIGTAVAPLRTDVGIRGSGSGCQLRRSKVRMPGLATALHSSSWGNNSSSASSKNKCASQQSLECVMNEAMDELASIKQAEDDE